MPDLAAPLTEVLVHLDATQAQQVQWIGAAWGLTPEQVVQGLIFNRLAECAAAAVPAVLPTQARRVH